MPPAPTVLPPEPPARDRNFVHLEALGNGGLYSLNYNRVLWKDVTARVGVSYVGASAGFWGAGGEARLVTAPAMANYVGLGSERNRLEMGLGVLLVYASGGVRLLRRGLEDNRTVLMGTATFGYRYLPRDGFTINVGFTPIFGVGLFLPSATAGIGHTF